MARLLKCYGSCEKKYEKDKLFKYKEKNYCEKCYNEIRENDKQRQLLLSIISKYYNIPYPTGRMLREMKTFREERNYKYEDQAKAIIYLCKIQKKKLYSKYGLALIPYVIDDAVLYYKKQEERMEAIKDKKNVYEKKTITMKVQKNRKEDYVNNKIIDWNDLN